MKRKFKQPLELIFLSIIAILLCSIFTGDFIIASKIVVSIVFFVLILILVYSIAMVVKEYWESIFKE